MTKNFILIFAICLIQFFSVDSYGVDPDEIYKFLTDRYGDFILLKPPVQLSTLALWFLPSIFFIIGIFIIFWHNKKSKKI